MNFFERNFRIVDADEFTKVKGLVDDSRL